MGIDIYDIRASRRANYPFEAARAPCPFAHLAAKRREQFLVALECFQDGLGDLNDIAVHEQRIAEIGIRSRRSNPKRAFAAGLLTGREGARIDAAMAAATQAFADLAKCKPFWP